MCFDSLTGRSLYSNTFGGFFPHRLTSFQPRDYRVVFVIQDDEEEPKNLAPLRFFAIHFALFGFCCLFRAARFALFAFLRFYRRLSAAGSAGTFTGRPSARGQIPAVRVRVP